MAINSRWFLTLAGTLGPLFLKVLGRTWRIRQSGVDYYTRRKQGADKRTIYSIWHRDILLLGYFGRNQGVRVLISEHQDGELIARVVQKMGYGVFRGSTTRGGMKALRHLDRIKADPSNCDIAFTPDGPKGPRKKVQKGVIYAASRTGFPISPIGTAVCRSWELPSWDRFRIPKPFSACYVVFGPEIAVPPGVSDEELERYRRELEEEMGRVEERAIQALKGL